MRHRIAVIGDTLTSGGHVLPYEEETGLIFGGHGVAVIGGRVYCAACNGIGLIAGDGGLERLLCLNAVKVALDGDIVLCKCPKRPRIAASGKTARYGTDGAHAIRLHLDHRREG